MKLRALLSLIPHQVTWPWKRRDIEPLPGRTRIGIDRKR